MLNIKNVAEQLNAVGIQASEDDILQWIDEGKIKAELNQRRNASYKIHTIDLTEFIIQKRTEDLESKLHITKHENRVQKDQLEVLKTRIQIEQSKVRTLKKMLNTQIEAAATKTYPLEEFLGLGQHADHQALKKEFKKLLKALHPDRGGDERLFKVFHEHYEKLKS